MDGSRIKHAFRLKIKLLTGALTGRIATSRDTLARVQRFDPREAATKGPVEGYAIPLFLKSTNQQSAFACIIMIDREAVRILNATLLCHNMILLYHATPSILCWHGAQRGSGRKLNWHTVRESRARQ